VAADAPAAFFSYCRDDSDCALRLAEDLKAAGAVVWIDQLDIEPGMRWDRAVQDALNNCPRMLVILSPASVNSDNVLDEVARALRKQKTVIPVLYLECDIPLQLERHHHIDFRTDHARGLKVLLKALGVQPPTEPSLAERLESARKRVQETHEPKKREPAAKPAGPKRGRAVRKGAVREDPGPVRASDGHALKMRELRTLTGHSGSVYGLAVTPDGQHAVSASEDHTLKVWELGSGRELRTLTGHSHWVTAVAVTLDGQHAVSASRDQTLKVWDLTKGRELCTLAGHMGEVTAVATTPDGERAVSASWDNTLKAWDLVSGRELRTLTGHSDRVWAVAVTPGGQLAVSASCDHTLKVWELGSGRELRTLTGHAGPVSAVAVTPDGQRVVSASEDQTLRVWELGSGRELRSLTGHSSVVAAVAVALDGERAVSASCDHTLKVWELASGRDLATFEADAALLCCAVSPDGKTILAGDANGVIHCLRLE
jgi:WD40 repeat protein